MRSPLPRMIAGLLVVSGPAAAPAAPPDVYGIAVPDGQLLPRGDRNLPVIGTPAGAARSMPLAPSVQAIPTPTAFHAGCGLLVATVVFRRFRRRDARGV